MISITKFRINPEKRDQITKCQYCGGDMHPCDIVEQFSSMLYYPYEGYFDLFQCPHCGAPNQAIEDNRVIAIERPASEGAF